MSIASAAVSPIALQPGEGETLWAFGALATIKASSETTDSRVAVIEHLAPQGAGSPLHVHHREDEWFYVTEGTVTFWVGGKVIEAPAGSFVYGPRDIPHTFLVTSPEALGSRRLPSARAAETDRQVLGQKAEEALGARQRARSDPAAWPSRATPTSALGLTRLVQTYESDSRERQ